MLLIEQTLTGYIDEVKGEKPAPGGGSVSAYAGALGAALTQMVGSLTIGKKAFEDVPEAEKAAMERAQSAYDGIRLELQEIVDTDATSFDDVMKAFKLPKETDEEKRVRSEAIQTGYKKALEIPLRAAELCLEGLRLQDIFARFGNKNAITDVGVGTLLLQSGLEGALFNVLINLKSIKDEGYRAEIERRVHTLMDEGKSLKEQTLAIVYGKLR